MTACSKSQVLEDFDNVLQAVGSAVLTDSGDLQGRRRFGADSYVGSYEAGYESFSGWEVLFGGTGLGRELGNEIRISGTLRTKGGTLRLMLQSGADEPVVLCDAAGPFSATVELPPASNYIFVTAEGFTGSLDLTIE